MRKLKITSILLSAFAAVAMTSCDEGGNPDAGGTTTEKYAGEWFLGIYDTDLNLLLDRYKFAVYNAASNDENFWIDDNNNPQIQLKTKVQADLANNTFAGPVGAEEMYTEGVVTISNGKLIKNGATSLGGHTVDSLYFEAEFDWDPGTIYVIAGHKRTGFLEDELP